MFTEVDHRPAAAAAGASLEIRDEVAHGGHAVDDLPVRGGDGRDLTRQHAGEAGHAWTGSSGRASRERPPPPARSPASGPAPSPFRDPSRAAARSSRSRRACCSSGARLQLRSGAGLTHARHESIIGRTVPPRRRAGVPVSGRPARRGAGLGEASLLQQRSTPVSTVLGTGPGPWSPAARKASAPPLLCCLLTPESTWC